MSQKLRANRTYGGICRHCDHDLEVRGRLGGPSDGKVYCSNARCEHHTKPHPAKATINRGRVK